jgi:hypothetical protein
MGKKEKTEKDIDDEVLHQIQKREAASSALKKILNKLNEEENKKKKRK